MKIETIGILLSALAILVSIASIYLALKATKEAGGFSERVHKTQFAMAWQENVVEWAYECIDVVSRMRIEIELISNKDTANSVLNLAKLSSLIDQGRLLFENDRKNEYGEHKQTAYRGFRPTLLDHLVDSYACYKHFQFGGAENPKGVIETLETLQRNFVSEIQDIIEPHWFVIKAKHYREEIK